MLVLASITNCIIANVNKSIRGPGLLEDDVKDKRFGHRSIKHIGSKKT